MHSLWLCVYNIFVPLTHFCFICECFCVYSFFTKLFRHPRSWNQRSPSPKFQTLQLPNLKLGNRSKILSILRPSLFLTPWNLKRKTRPPRCLRCRCPSALPAGLRLSIRPGEVLSLSRRNVSQAPLECGAMIHTAFSQKTLSLLHASTCSRGSLTQSECDDQYKSMCTIRVWQQKQKFKKWRQSQEWLGHLDF